MKVLGVDPDLHNTALAVADSLEIVHMQVVSIDAKLKGRDAVVAMCQALWCHMPHFVEASGSVSAVVVEGQRIYEKSKANPQGTPNPQSILWLGQVAGAALMAAQTYTLCPNVVFPYPHEWKGSSSKAQNQRRTFRRYGIEDVTESKHRLKKDRYVYPSTPLPGFEHVTKAQWKHVADALGLCHWAATGLDEQLRRGARLADPSLNAALGRRGLTEG